MTNKENFLKLVSEDKTDTLERNRDRIRNRKQLRESRAIAMKVLFKLDDLGWSKKDLADKMNVSPQQITKIVKGKENMKLETQIKLQEILNIPILATFEEDSRKTIISELITIVESFKIAIFPTRNASTMQSIHSKKVKTEYYYDSMVSSGNSEYLLI